MCDYSPRSRRAYLLKYREGGRWHTQGGKQRAYGPVDTGPVDTGPVDMGPLEAPIHCHNCGVLSLGLTDYLNG